MSLNIYLKDNPSEVVCVCECDHIHKKIHSPIMFEINITHNLINMAEEAGIYKVIWRPDEIGIKKAKDMIDILEEGLLTLQAEPLNFKRFNPRSGWGSYQSLLCAVSELLEACKEFPESNVEVHR